MNTIHASPSCISSEIKPLVDAKRLELSVTLSNEIWDILLGDSNARELLHLAIISHLNNFFDNREAE